MICFPIIPFAIKLIAELYTTVYHSRETTWEYQREQTVSAQFAAFLKIKVCVCVVLATV